MIQITQYNVNDLEDEVIAEGASFTIHIGGSKFHIMDNADGELEVLTQSKYSGGDGAIITLSSANMFYLDTVGNKSRNK